MAKLPVVSMDTCIRSYPQFYSQFTSNGTFCAGSRNGMSLNIFDSSIPKMENKVKKLVT